MIIDVPRPALPATPLSEKDRTEYLIEYLKDYFMSEKLASQDKEFNLSKFSRFSGGGDNTTCKLWTDCNWRDCNR